MAGAIIAGAVVLFVYAVIDCMGTRLRAARLNRLAPSIFDLRARREIRRAPSPSTGWGSRRAVGVLAIGGFAAVVLGLVLANQFAYAFAFIAVCSGVSALASRMRKP